MSTKKILLLGISALLCSMVLVTTNASAETTKTTTSAEVSLTKGEYYTVTVPDEITIVQKGNGSILVKGDYALGIQGSVTQNKLVSVTLGSSFRATSNSGKVSCDVLVNFGTNNKKTFNSSSIASGVSEPINFSMGTKDAKEGTYSGYLTFSVNEYTMSPTLNTTLIQSSKQEVKQNAQ